MCSSRGWKYGSRELMVPYACLMLLAGLKRGANLAYGVASLRQRCDAAIEVNLMYEDVVRLPRRVHEDTDTRRRERLCDGSHDADGSEIKGACDFQAAKTGSRRRSRWCGALLADDRRPIGRVDESRESALGPGRMRIPGGQVGQGVPIIEECECEPSGHVFDSRHATVYWGSRARARHGDRCLSHAPICRRRAPVP
jgi:hypothetical protein